MFVFVEEGFSVLALLTNIW